MRIVSTTKRLKITYLKHTERRSRKWAVCAGGSVKSSSGGMAVESNAPSVMSEYADTFERVRHRALAEVELDSCRKAGVDSCTCVHRQGTFAYRRDREIFPNTHHDGSLPTTCRDG